LRCEQREGGVSASRCSNVNDETQSEAHPGAQLAAWLWCGTARGGAARRSVRAQHRLGCRRARGAHRGVAETLAGRVSLLRGGRHPVLDGGLMMMAWYDIYVPAGTTG
jgi:hypothetical protein